MIAVQTALEDIGLDAGTLLSAAVVLAGAYVLVRVVGFVLSALAERSPTRRVTIKLFVPIVSFLVYGAAVYVVLRPLLQLSTSQLLAVSGLLGAAIGFGLKDLFAGVVGGLLLVVERPYRVGDKVTLRDHYGEVTGIGLRSTTLQTPDDTTVSVPNGALFTEHVANENDGAQRMLVVVEVAVAPDADLDVATEIVREALVTSRYVYVDDDHPVAVRVSDDTYYRTIAGKAYVGDLRDEFAFETDVSRRAIRAFDERGIETPAVRPHGPPDAASEGASR